MVNVHTVTLPSSCQTTAHGTCLLSLSSGRRTAKLLKEEGASGFKLNLAKRANLMLFCFWTKTTLSEENKEKKKRYLPLSVLSYEQDLKCLWLFAYEGKCQDLWIICWKLTLICGGFRQSHQNIHHSARRGSLWLFHYTFRSSVHCFRPEMTWRPFGWFILVCHCHSRPTPRNENTSKPSTRWTPPKGALSDFHMSGKL